MPANDRVLVTGSMGQLGFDLTKYLSAKFDVTAVDQAEMDITSRNAVMGVLTAVRPSIVIHTAAYTDVDGAESNEKLAMAVNAGGTENVALGCKAVGAKLVYYSTDYVFDGTKGSAYFESDVPNPATIYGKSKLAGEERVLALLDDYVTMRIAWLYGIQGKNFVKTMIRLGKEQMAGAGNGLSSKPIRVVDDQVGNPTWTMDIVRQTEEILSRNLCGLFHATSEGETTWYGLARLVFDELHLDRVMLEPCTTAEYPRSAPRPSYSSLENDRLKGIGINIMRSYRQALSEFLQIHHERLQK